MSKKTKKAKPVVVPKRHDVFDQWTVSSEKDLDALLKRHPHLAAITDTDKKIRKTLKSKPVELMCGPDEVLYQLAHLSPVSLARLRKRAMT